MKRGMLMVAVLALMVGLVAWAARGQARDTPAREAEMVVLTAGEALPGGVLAGVWTNGLVYAASDEKELAIVGRVEAGAAEGAKALLRRGCFRWDNGGGTIGAEHIGREVYVWTNTAWTVCLEPLTAVTNVAGRVMDVDDGGVWVRSGY